MGESNSKLWLAVGSVSATGAVIAMIIAGKMLAPKALGPLPAKMKRLLVIAPNDDLAKVVLDVREVDLPKPQSGQVLVKMAAAPMNPSDYNFLRTKGNNVEYPAEWGNEGSGTVVATGGGLLGVSLLGKKVAIMGSRLGTFGQYAVCSAMTTFKLPEDMPAKDGCGFTVNPWTAIAIAETSKKHGGVLINTAGASALGKMLVTLCIKRKLTLINIVRSEEQAQLLRKLGATHVLVSPKVITLEESIEKEKFSKALKDLIQKTKCKCAFDCIGGYMTGLLLSLVPYGGTVYVYGRIADEPVGGLGALDLIYRNKQVKGLFLGNFIRDLGFFGVLKTSKQVSSLLTTDFKTQFTDYTMEDATKKIKEMAGEGRSLTNAKARVIFE